MGIDQSKRNTKIRSKYSSCCNISQARNGCYQLDFIPNSGPISTFGDACKFLGVAPAADSTPEKDEQRLHPLATQRVMQGKYCADLPPKPTAGSAKRRSTVSSGLGIVQIRKIVGNSAKTAAPNDHLLPDLNKVTNVETPLREIRQIKTIRRSHSKLRVGIPPLSVLTPRECKSRGTQSPVLPGGLSNESRITDSSTAQKTDSRVGSEKLMAILTRRKARSSRFVLSRTRGGSERCILEVRGAQS